MSAVAVSASEIREQVILSHLPQVRIAAGKLHRNCPPHVLVEDLVSAGIVGLVDAYHRFDSRRKVKFKTFAEWRIRGGMLDYLRQLDPLRRAVRRFQKSRTTTMARMSIRSAAQPTDDVIACEMGMKLEKYRKLVMIARASDPQSFDVIAGNGGVRDHYASTGVDFDLGHWALEAAIRKLPKVEMIVITAVRSGDTNRVIAERLHVTESRISQIKTRAISRLRIALGVQPPSGR